MKASRWYRPALSLLVAIAMVWLWSTRIDELMYHTIGSMDLVELGDATSLSELAPNIPYNKYVEVSGILGNKAATLRGLRAGSFRMGRYQVRHLLGSKLYIEYDESIYHQKFSPFTRVVVRGRLTPFGPGSELQKVRTFFKDYYNQTIDDKAMLLVVDEKPRSEFRYGLLFAVSLLLLVVSIYSSVRWFRLASRE